MVKRSIPPAPVSHSELAEMIRALRSMQSRFDTIDYPHMKLGDAAYALERELGERLVAEIVATP